MMYSDDEDDYGYMGHGEGPSLDHFSVLPGIPSVLPSSKRNDEDSSTVKIRKPLKVLPDIKLSSERKSSTTLVPRPPTTKKKHRKSRKRPPPVNVRGGTFDILPEIQRKNVGNAAGIDVCRRDDEMQFYDNLLDVDDRNAIASRLQQHDVLNYFRDDLENFKFDMAYEEKLETPRSTSNASTSQQDRCDASTNMSSTKLHKRHGRSFKPLSNEIGLYHGAHLVPSPPKSSKRLNTSNSIGGDDGSKRRRSPGRQWGGDNILSHPSKDM